jgi:hypothetical protein
MTGTLWIALPAYGSEHGVPTSTGALAFETTNSGSGGTAPSAPEDRTSDLGSAGR